MRTLAAALIIGLIWPAAPLHAREPLRLQPATKWVLEYAEENCRLARKFGQGAQQVTLVLDQFEPGDFFRLILVGQPVKPRLPMVSGRLRFGPHEEKSDFEAEAGTLSQQPALLLLASMRLAPLTDQEEAASDRAKRRGISYDPPPLGAAREAAATWLEVTKGLRQDLLLETGPMHEPMAALRTCSWDMVKHWGLNVDQQKTLSRKVQYKTKPATWFTSEDYPASMVAAGYQGLVTVRTMVDAAGRPTACRVQRSTQPKQFDDVVCAAVMKRARFQPALDAQGRPVQSFTIVTVRFQLAG